MYLTATSEIDRLSRKSFFLLYFTLSFCYYDKLSTYPLGVKWTKISFIIIFCLENKVRKKSVGSCYMRASDLRNDGAILDLEFQYLLPRYR